MKLFIFIVIVFALVCLISGCASTPKPLPDYQEGQQGLVILKMETN